ncbi:MAG: hypothetical protein K2X97_20455, partial [Mycobacteriaceae bacterium]|nr:hypothetical protein [Mycobacteriaceae bacterium]
NHTTPACHIHNIAGQTLTSRLCRGRGQRAERAISVLVGATTVIDIGGRRIVMDPTFDPAGPARLSD